MGKLTMQRLRTSWRIWIVAALVVIAGAASAVGWSLTRPRAPSFRGAAVNPPYPAPDFTLVDQRGEPFRFSSLRGKVVALYFGYTFCPDACPGTLLNFRQARQLLGSQADRVQFVFVSVDPERDSPERIREYLSNFDPSFLGLTGKPAEVTPVLRQYGVVAEKVYVEGSSAGYLMNHTASVYLIDPNGMMRVMVFYGQRAEDLAHDIRQLL